MVLNTVNELPDKFSLDELIDKLLFINKVDQGISDLDSGKIVTNEEAARRLEKWLK